MSEVTQKGRAAKEASFLMAAMTTEEKNEALLLMADQLRADKGYLIEANGRDLSEGKSKGLTASILDRIMLDEQRIDAIADAIVQVSNLADPLGEVLETIEKENGLFIQRKRVPVGVVGMIYEARPNVTIDAAALTLKTGNSVMLRGSSSARHSNIALVSSIHKALGKSALPADAVQLIEDTSRETAKELFRLNDYLDVLIPRGGKNLIDTVVREATVPVIETGAGNCHIYIDRTADVQMAEEIVLNAKLQRPSVCNAAETLLIHHEWFAEHGEALLNSLHDRDVIIHGDATVCQRDRKAIEAKEEDWRTEYLDLEISVKVVGGIREAIDHINTYGTRHSEAILTSEADKADLFMQQVDAAAVYHNASTRFTDGFEFGYGAEIGISTQKLHARGPMGLKALTSSKFFVKGNGQIRK